MARGSKPSERRGGRKKGVPNKATVATRARIEREADPIGFLGRVMRGEPILGAPLKGAEKAVEMIPTVDQRIAAARILADKLVPNAKSRPISLKLPEIGKADDLVAAIAAVLQAMASAEITPEEAATVAGVLELKRRAIETVEIERRLAAIEAAQERNRI